MDLRGEELSETGSAVAETPAARVRRREVARRENCILVGLGGLKVWVGYVIGVMWIGELMRMRKEEEVAMLGGLNTLSTGELLM